MTRILVFLLCFSTSVAAAQPTPQVMEFQGQPGLWFSQSDAARILLVWREHERLELRVPILESMLANREQRVADLQVALELSRETNSELLTSNRQLARAATPRWWTSPYFWLAIGLVIGSTSTIVIYRNR